MPPSLRLLESREKKCVERLHDLKEEALTAGVEEHGSLQVNLSDYLNNISHQKDEDLDKCLKMADNLPRILELIRQATVEEKRRRKYQTKITKIYKARNTKINQMLREQEKRRKKQLKRLTRMQPPQNTQEAAETEDIEDTKETKESEEQNM